MKNNTKIIFSILVHISLLTHLYATNSPTSMLETITFAELFPSATLTESDISHAFSQINQAVDSIYKYLAQEKVPPHIHPDRAIRYHIDKSSAILQNITRNISDEIPQYGVVYLIVQGLLSKRISTQEYFFRKAVAAAENIDHLDEKITDLLQNVITPALSVTPDLHHTTTHKKIPVQRTIVLKKTRAHIGR